MRGQEKNIKKLLLSGNIWLLFEEDEQLISPLTGDLKCYINLDTMTGNLIKGNYYKTGKNGYIKADIFDGRKWQPLLVNDFFENKENYFNKSEKPIDTYNICREILAKCKDFFVYKTYREHYTKYEPIESEYKGKKGHFKKK